MRRRRARGALCLLLAAAAGDGAAGAGAAAGGAEAEAGGVDRITMADFKVRMSNAYPTGGAAFSAMVQSATSLQGSAPAPPAASGRPGGPSLSLPGFVLGVGAFRPPLSRDEAEFAFRGLDSDHDGQLAQAEFLEVLWTGRFLPASGPPEELGQAITTITSSRSSTTTGLTTTYTPGAPGASPAATAPPAVSYSVTEAVVQDEGQSMGDYTDRDYTLEECKALCNRATGCNSFAYFNGDCHLKDRCVLPGEPLDRRSSFRTYYKACALQAYAYVELGPGYCPHGYYAGGDPVDAANLARCQARCSAEPECEFISLHMKDTCSRYNKKAGSCSERPLGHADHVTYRRVAMAPAPRERVKTLMEGVSDGESPQSVFGSSLVRDGDAQQEAVRAGGPKPITMADFKEAVRAGGPKPITMADFKARMLKAYASSVHAFQALGTNPSGLEDFVRGVTTFEPPLTFEQAKYAFRGLDMDHDDMLRSFEFFEVIECGHFFPTSKELAELHGSDRVFRAPALSRSQRQPGGSSSAPALAAAFGLMTCLFSVLLALGLRLAGKAQPGGAPADSYDSYTAILPLQSDEGTTSTRASSGSARRELVSL